MTARWLVLFLVAALAPACSALAQLEPRVSVTVQLNQTTTFGQSVFVLGDLPELGAWDMTRAVKLDPSAYPIWRATISIPAGRSYAYRFVLRSDGPGQTSQASNGTFITPSNINALAPDSPRTPATKALFLTWNMDKPVLRYRTTSTATEAATPFASRTLELFGPSAPGRTGERTWFAWNFLPAGGAFDFYFTDAQGNSRYPASGWYTTNLDGVFVQDGQLYSYIPAAAPSAARRDYSPSAVPTLFSPQLNENRGYRVFLPRGYDQHPTRRYPVLYMHDGQNVFESGPFGSWNAAATVTTLQAQGRMRETIIVALDNGPNRLTDYLPPTDLLPTIGRGDSYGAYIRDTVKPFIDSRYRTLTGPGDTGALGSSMGGVISLYLGWDFTSTFTRVGLLSGAWQTCPNYLTRVRSTLARPIKIYMDSGDSGTSSDNYWESYNLRHALVGTTAPKYTIEGTLRHTIGYGQQHNEAAWTIRLPGALTFLYPAQEEPNTLLRTQFGPHWDVNADGVMTIEDLYAQARAPRDLNLDGTLDDADTALLERFLRRFDTGMMIGAQR